MTDTAEIAFKAAKLMLTVILVAHWLACLFWTVGIAQGNQSS